MYINLYFWINTFNFNKYVVWNLKMHIKVDEWFNELIVSIIYFKCIVTLEN